MHKMIVGDADPHRHEIEKALDRWLVYPQKLLKNQWAQAKAKDLYINVSIPAHLDIGT